MGSVIVEKWFRIHSSNQFIIHISPINLTGGITHKTKCGPHSPMSMEQKTSKQQESSWVHIAWSMPSTRPESIINGFGFEAGQASQVIFFSAIRNGEEWWKRAHETWGEIWRFTLWWFFKLWWDKLHKLGFHMKLTWYKPNITMAIMRIQWEYHGKWKSLRPSPRGSENIPGSFALHFKCPTWWFIPLSK